MRFPIEVAPDDVRRQDAALGARSRRSGDRVVYQALGHLWIRDLPDGTPRRLTQQNDHFEFYPVVLARRPARSSTRPGTTRSSAPMRVAPAAGGEGRVGDRRSPATTSSRRSRPTARRSSTARRATASCARRSGRASPGIYVIPTARRRADAASPKKGALPQFGADERPRLSSSRFEDEDKRALRSIELDGSDERAAR